MTRKVVNEAYGLPSENISRIGKSVPYIIDFGRFWRQAIDQEIQFHEDRELFLGIDYNSVDDRLHVTEQTLGTRTECEPQKNHLVELHTHVPYTKKDLESKILGFSIHRPTPRDVFLSNVPTPYYGDVQRLTEEEIYCIIITCLMPPHCPTLVLIKTKEFKPNIQEVFYDMLMKIL